MAAARNSPQGTADQASERPFGRPAPEVHEAELLLLGTFHFTGSSDAVSVHLDPFTARRRRELDQVVEDILTFRPTAVAVEAEPAVQTLLDERFARYADGTGEAGASEIEQLGFRLARDSGLPGVVGIDHQVEIPFSEVLAYADEHLPYFAARFRSRLADRQLEDQQAIDSLPVAAALRRENDGARLRELHSLYLELSAVGAGDTDVGSRMLAAWYERNIWIYGNLMRLAEGGERVLAILGAGHVRILRQLLTDTPRCRLVPVDDYLVP